MEPEMETKALTVPEIQQATLEPYKGHSLVESNSFNSAMQFAQLVAKSTMVPKTFFGRPGDIVAAIQMGYELGLAPMQALQNIAVINGKPSLWGDAVLAVCMKHPDCEDIVEEVKDGVATCTAKRKGKTPVVRSFSLKDAEKAGLLGKTGPWTQYTNRMLQMRARGFALRDAFPDALRGLITAEEASDYPTK